MKTAIPEDWHPTPTLWDFAVKNHSMPSKEVNNQTELFRNYWLDLADKEKGKKTREGWARAWQNWAIKAESYNPGWKPLPDEREEILTQRHPVESSSSIEECHPLPLGSIFKKGIRHHTEEQRVRLKAWREKALKALSETGLTGREAAEWMQMKMKDAG